MDRGEILLHDLVGGLLQAHALVLHEGADGARHGKPDEILACAGCRDSTRMIRSVGSSADDGGIANSVPALGRDAAGGGTGRDVATAVERDDADRAVLVRVRPFRCSDGLGRRRGGPPSGRGGMGEPSFSSWRTRSCQRRSVKKKAGGTCSRCTCAAKSSAPEPTSMTWDDCSITARASEMG